MQQHASSNTKAALKVKIATATLCSSAAPPPPQSGKKSPPPSVYTAPPLAAPPKSPTALPHQQHHSCTVQQHQPQQLSVAERQICSSLVLSKMSHKACHEHCTCPSKFRGNIIPRSKPRVFEAGQFRTVPLKTVRPSKKEKKL